MKHIKIFPLIIMIAILLLSVKLFLSCSPTSLKSNGDSDTTSTSDLNFVPDSGVRVDNASLPAPSIDDSGIFYLYYDDNSDSKLGKLVATSSNGLDFSSGITPTEWTHDPRILLMPEPDSNGNPIYRRYLSEPDNGLISQSSSNGVNFTSDQGIRYTLHPSDNATIGVYDHFIDSAGGITLLYIGDMTGLNNVRRAYSQPGDNGWTFTFDRGNVLGDAADGGGPNSYVGQKSIQLPNGQRRLFTMKQGTIYSFISNDDGKTFTLESGTRLAPSDFTEFNVITLHDPWVVLLKSGQYQMYVAASVDMGSGDNKFVIISATTPGS